MLKTRKTLWTLCDTKMLRLQRLAMRANRTTGVRFGHLQAGTAAKYDGDFLDNWSHMHVPRERLNALPEMYPASIDRPEEFWGEAAKSLHWHKMWDKVCSEHTTSMSHVHTHRCAITNRTVCCTGKIMVVNVNVMFLTLILFSHMCVSSFMSEGFSMKSNTYFMRKPYKFSHKSPRLI